MGRTDGQLFVWAFSLEQYGRRSLIRISGLSERATGDETTTAVRKIMSEIDPDHKPEDVNFYNILFSYGHLL
jgi:hypothetical protein